MSAIHGLPSSLWYAFRAGTLYEQRNNLVERAKADAPKSWQRGRRLRYARRCNWEMLRLLREARTASIDGM